MENKNDIGRLIKSRLSKAQVPLENELWDRLEGSLDSSHRKKRGFLWLWSIGGAAAILLFLLLTNSNPTSELDAEQNLENNLQIMTQIDSLLNASEENSEQKITYGQLDSLLKDSFYTPPGEDTISEATQTNKFVSKDDRSNTVPKTRNKNPFEQEDVTIKTTYYYYNSELEETFETTDRQLIDSLINEGFIETDSTQVKETTNIPMRKKDSLG